MSLCAPYVDGIYCEWCALLCTVVPCDVNCVMWCEL